MELLICLKKSSLSSSTSLCITHYGSYNQHGILKTWQFITIHDSSWLTIFSYLSDQSLGNMLIYWQIEKAYNRKVLTRYTILSLWFRTERLLSVLFFSLTTIALCYVLLCACGSCHNKKWDEMSSKKNPNLNLLSVAVREILYKSWARGLSIRINRALKGLSSACVGS